MPITELLKSASLVEIKQQYQTDILVRLSRSRLIVLPCYFISIAYFLYADIYVNHFMPAAYARLPVISMTAIFAGVSLVPRWYQRWGYQLHHLCLFTVMAMMTFILSQSGEKPFYNSAITACVMVILIVLVEERGGLKVTLPIYLIPAISCGVYFFMIDLPRQKAMMLGNPVIFIFVCLAYSKVQENFRWRDFLNMKTIELQKKEAEGLYNELLIKNNEIVNQKDEIYTQNQALLQLVSTVEQQSQAIQLQNSKITSSIAYAQRLQSVILPQEQRFAQALGPDNYFILYQPRDIVSGDFYWLYSDADQFILAVVDCTGHGVPGAFMSVIGSQLLTELVELRQVYSPDKILNEMHRQVRRILKQDQSDSRDGMDIQLIRWQKDQQTLQFAGAMTPCYCLTLANGQLLEIRADRKAIGGEQAEEERLFTLQEIEVTSPTLLYLCTDGYQDQFGGPKGKKFMSSQLKTLLASLADQPLKDQETILAHTIEDWRALGNEQQVDDITIVGLRIG